MPTIGVLRTISGAAEHRLRAPPDLGKGPPPRFFTQHQDHFDASNQQTWQQAYFVNDTFWKLGSDAPVFLCVGGEGPALDGSVVVSSVHCNNAVELLPETGALMFAVEHRYYGCHNASACPYTPWDPHPLRFLSSRQALADLATFHAHAVSAYKLSSANKWVSFGGSYPGMLAGWIRMLYPSLIFASIASSAPVHAQLDMTEYNTVLARAYSLESVGGSASCRDAIGTGHAEIGRMMATKVGRYELAPMFAVLRRRGAEWLADRQNRLAFAGDGVAAFPAQSNDPSCNEPACNIARICELMTDTIGAMANATAVQRLAHLAATQAELGASRTHDLPNSQGGRELYTHADASGDLVRTGAHSTLDARSRATPSAFARFEGREAAGILRAQQAEKAGKMETMYEMEMEDVKEMEMEEGKELDEMEERDGSEGTEKAKKTQEDLAMQDMLGEQGMRAASTTFEHPSRLSSPSGLHASLDYWGYQTCTEFGFYQTCEVGTGCFFTQGLNLLLDQASFCETDFGIRVDEIAGSVAATNAKYGGRAPDKALNASRIMFVNGDVDPWSSMSILKSPTTSLPTLMVPGASHHAWTHPSQESDQKSVKRAREVIRDQLRRWLAMSPHAQ